MPSLLHWARRKDPPMLTSYTTSSACQHKSLFHFNSRPKYDLEMSIAMISSVWNFGIHSRSVCNYCWMHLHKLKYWSSCNTKRRLRLHAHGFGISFPNLWSEITVLVFASCRHMRYDRTSEKRKVLFRRHASLLKRTTQMDEADATFLPAVNINAASLGEAAGSVCSPRIIWRHGLG
jgi:hypothetical protein